MLSFVVVIVVAHLIRAFVTPRKDVRARVTIKTLWQTTHDTFLDKLPLLDCHGGKCTVEHAGGFIGEGGLFHIDFGAVNLCFRMRGHGC